MSGDFATLWSELLEAGRVRWRVGMLDRRGYRWFRDGVGFLYRILAERTEALALLRAIQAAPVTP